MADFIFLPATATDTSAGELFRNVNITDKVNVSDNVSFEKFLKITGLEEAVVREVDHTVANQSEFDALIATGAAALSGKIIEITGVVDEAYISNFQPTEKVIIRTSETGSITHATMATAVDNVEWQCKFQMTGWPKTHDSCVLWQNGTYNNNSFRNSTFRHGYGSTLIDVDTAADLPEYNRVDNVITANTTASTHTISYQDAAADDATIFVFNRGTDTIWIGTGTNTPDTTVAGIAAGTFGRINVNPQVDTQVTVISNSGSQTVNARTEIGLSYYQAQAFSRFGGAVATGLFEITDCQFSDLNNGIKSIPEFAAGSTIVMWKNDMARIYQDTISFSATNAGEIHVIDNLLDTPFARSGIAEGLLGDARDPHGDMIQCFGDGLSSVSGMFLIGNTNRLIARRTGVLNQGLFISDNKFTPSYSDVTIVGNIVLNGNARGLSLGDPDYPVNGVYIWGNTVLNGYDLIGGTSKIIGYAVDDDSVSVLDSIAQGFTSQGAGQFQLVNSLDLSAVDASAIFPNFANLATATTRAEIRAALTVSGAGVGKGFAVADAAINRDAATYDLVYDASKSNPGLVFPAVTNATPNALYEFDAKRVNTGGMGLAVAPNVGTEVRILDTDGTTVLTDWTSTSTTIDEGQFITMRVTAGDDITTVPVGFAIGEFTTSSTVTSGITATGQFVLNGTTFGDPVNVPAGTEAFEMTAQLILPVNTGGYVTIFTQEASVRLEVNVSPTTSLLRVYAEDGNNASLVPLTDLSDLTDLVSAGQLHQFKLKLDYAAGTLISSVDNNSQTITFTPTSNPTAQSNREIRFGGQTETTARLPNGTIAQRFRVFYKPTLGDYSLHKEISVAEQGSVASINADAWYEGNGPVTAVT